MIKHNRRNSLFLSLSLGIALTLAGGLNSSTLAQSGTDNQDYQSNEKDTTYGDAPAGLNPLELMHRAQQLNGRSAAEFDEESQAQINNSASDYKRLQQQRILEMQQQKTGNTETEETTEAVE
jgi:hypothetical protein